MASEHERAGQATSSSRGTASGDAGLGEWMAPLVDALDHAVVERVHEDPFQRDPRAVEQFLPYFQASSLYFGCDLRGWENLPADGPFLIVGNHSGGAETSDASALMARWIEERGPEAPFYSLAYDLLFAYPLIGPMLPRLGMLPASQENARRALGLGAGVIVFPGGDYEVFRPWSRRNEIDFGGRKGFIELAIAAGVPVVPMTTHGAHESTFVLTRGRRLARSMGLDRLHIKVFPWIWNIPFGVTPAYVPSVQLPSKVTIQLGEPIDWSRHDAEQAQDPDVLQQCYDEITGVMQRTLTELASEHPYPVLERLNELRPLNLWRRFSTRRDGAE